MAERNVIRKPLICLPKKEVQSAREAAAAAAAMGYPVLLADSEAVYGEKELLQKAAAVLQKTGKMTVTKSLCGYQKADVTLAEGRAVCCHEYMEPFPAESLSVTPPVSIPAETVRKMYGMAAECLKKHQIKGDATVRFALSMDGDQCLAEEILMKPRPSEEGKMLLVPAENEERCFAGENLMDCLLQYAETAGKGVFHMEQYDCTDTNTLLAYVSTVHPDRIYAAAELLRRNEAIEKLHGITGIAEAFLESLKEAVRTEKRTPGKPA